jgi:DNA-binding MarR family transcriptional regulator
MTTERARDQLEPLVLIAAKVLRRAFDVGMVDLDLNISEGGVLSHLSTGGPFTQTELAERLHMGRASAGAVVDALEERGLIARQADPSDRRVWRIGLTPTGGELMERFDLRYAQIRTALYQGIGADEREKLGQLLQALTENATRYCDQGSADLDNQAPQPR